MRLGKRAKRNDARTLKLANYLPPPERRVGAETCLLPPARVDYTGGLADWGMMLNNRLSCCTIAAVAHAVETWTVNAGARVGFCDEAIRLYYEKWDGYDPADPHSDQGGVELDVLKQWRHDPFAGHGLEAFAEVGTGDSGLGAREVQTAIWLFGGLYVGLELPLSAQTQDVWHTRSEVRGPKSDAQNRELGIGSRESGPDAPGSWGGHAVYIVGYDFSQSGVWSPRSEAEYRELGVGNWGSGLKAPNVGLDAGARPAVPSPQPLAPSPFLLTCVTWGRLKQMTWAFFRKYCSEAYALVSKDWLQSSGISPSGFDLAALEADVEMISRQEAVSAQLSAIS